MRKSLAPYLQLVLVCALLATVGARNKAGGTRARQHRQKAQQQQQRVSENIDMSAYHSYDALMQEFTKLSARCPLTVTYLKGQHTSLPQVSIKLPNVKPQHRVLMFFGEHARELISPETALTLAQQLCGVSTENRELVTTVLANTEFLIFPLINVYGHQMVEKGQYCVRANENGVDLNRNWDDHWQGDQDVDRAKKQQSWGGNRAFSEEETVLLKQAAEAFKPTTFITVHSGTLGMYMPYAYSGKIPQKTPDDKAMLDILNTLNKKYCMCAAGAAGKQVGYLCPGTCLDYIYDFMNTHFSFAFEIYDGNEGFMRASASALLEEAGSTRLRPHHHHAHHHHHHGDEEEDELMGHANKHSCFVQDEPPVHPHHHPHSADDEDVFLLELDAIQSKHAERRRHQQHQQEKHVSHYIDRDDADDADDDEDDDDAAAPQRDDDGDRDRDDGDRDDTERDHDREDDEEADDSSSNNSNNDEEEEEADDAADRDVAADTPTPDSNADGTLDAIAQAAAAGTASRVQSVVTAPAVAVVAAATAPSAATAPKPMRFDAIFPQPADARQRSCLVNFNPVTRDEYKKTTEHWSKTFLELVYDVMQVHPAVVGSVNPQASDLIMRTGNAAANAGAGPRPREQQQQQPRREQQSTVISSPRPREQQQTAGGAAAATAPQPQFAPVRTVQSPSVVAGPQQQQQQQQVVRPGVVQQQPARLPRAAKVLVEADVVRR